MTAWETLKVCLQVGKSIEYWRYSQKDTSFPTSYAVKVFKKIHAKFLNEDQYYSYFFFCRTQKKIFKRRYLTRELPGYQEELLFFR